MHRILWIGLFGVIASAAFAQQPIQLETTERLDPRMAIAVPPFATAPGLEAYGPNLARVMARDFDFSGMFRIIGPDRYPSKFKRMPVDSGRIDFTAWKQSGAEFLVHGFVSMENDLIKLEFRMYSLVEGQQIVGQRLREVPKWARLMVHQFADEAVRFLDGVPGIASSEIVFSGGDGQNKEIYIADYDGTNAKQVTDHNSISINANVSPDGQRIAYLSYKDRYPWIYVYDRRTGRSIPFSRRVGLNHAPAWSPDGNRLAYVLSKDGNTEIYIKNIDGSGERRLTKNRFADTSPTFSSNGQQIAFISDRAGRPQVYVMNVDGSNPRRLSYQGGSSYDPEWSPNGQFIAYIVEKDGEGLELWMMNADGSGFRPLTQSIGSTESPTWSPDSRHVMFSSSRSGRAQMYTVTIETGVVRRVTGLESLIGEGPSWGPRR